MRTLALAAAAMALGTGVMAANAATPITAPINGATAGSWNYYTLSNGFHYDVLMPASYSTDYLYPVVLYLHGLSTEAPPGQPPNNAFPAIINSTNVNGVNFRANYPAIIVAPQCAGSTFGSNDWGGTRTYLDPKTNIVTQTKDMPCGDNAILALKEVLKTNSVDLNRIYIAGYSMGGFGTYYLYLKHRWLFAAAMPVSGAVYGGLTEAQYLEKIASHPFWSFHGYADSTVPKTWDEALYTAALQTPGAEMSYTEFVSPGVTTNFPSLTEYYGDGHANADIYAYSYTPAMNWLFSQVRQPKPTVKHHSK